MDVYEPVAGGAFGIELGTMGFGLGRGRAPHFSSVRNLFRGAGKSARRADDLKDLADNLNDASRAAGRVDCPPPKGSANPATKKAAGRGSTLHADKPGHLPDQLRQRYPDTQFEFTKAGVAGQDVKVVGGKHPSDYPGSTWPKGIDHADFKPGTPGGQKTFKADQKNKWAEPTQMLPYDPNSGDLQ
jgi:hypothetical protein